MSLGSMANELLGVVSQLPPDYAPTIIKRASDDVQRQNLWSFLMVEGNWTSPGLISAGTVAVTQGSNQVVFDAPAAAALNAIGLFPSPITKRQFRVGVGTIYNIWGWDGANTATLDRRYQEPSATGSSYRVYQCYYAIPVPFKSWIDVRDMVNYNQLITNRTRSWIDSKDPNRQVYYIPTHVVPYTIDLNPVSDTYQNQMFELWGQPNFQLTYQLFFVRKPIPLVNDADTLPPQVGEDCVMSMSRYYAYQWGEANWQTSWGAKPDFKFLMKEEVSNDRRPGRPLGLFNRLFGEYRMQDRAAVDNFMTTLRRSWSFPNLSGWYSSIGSTASPGAPW